MERGERPLEISGMAITIDGAFSEAYGDRGYTLILAMTARVWPSITTLNPWPTRCRKGLTSSPESSRSGATIRRDEWLIPNVAPWSAARSQC